MRVESCGKARVKWNSASFRTIPTYIPLKACSKNYKTSKNAFSVYTGHNKLFKPFSFVDNFYFALIGALSHCCYISDRNVQVINLFFYTYNLLNGSNNEHQNTGTNTYRTDGNNLKHSSSKITTKLIGKNLN